MGDIEQRIKKIVEDTFRETGVQIDDIRIEWSKRYGLIAAIQVNTTARDPNNTYA